MLFFSVALPLDHPKDVLGVHDPVLLPVELDFGPRILANDHHVPDTHLHAVFELAYRDDLGALGFCWAVSGSTMPEAVVSSGSSSLTNARRSEEHTSEL